MDSEGSQVGSVVVVGGSVAGWAAAARIAAAFPGTVRVTVLEDPRKVAETADTGTVLTAGPGLQRELFDHLGAAEEDWARACHASFRTTVRYVNWRTEGAGEPAARRLSGGGSDHFHRLYADLPDCGLFSLHDAWRSGTAAEPFDYACFREPLLLDAGKAPRWLDGRAALPYGWHLDAVRFAGYLRDLAVGRFGVRAVHDMPCAVERDAAGTVTELRTVRGRTVRGDVFLDCSGQAGILVAGLLDEPYLGADDELLCDSTVTATLEHDDEARGVEPFGTTLAMPEGWAWKTPLPGRFGTGYVFARALTDPGRAAEWLCALWGADPERATLRLLRCRTGRLRRAWVGNCVALGSAAACTEPLATDALDDVLDTLARLLRDLPAAAGAREVAAARFNRAFADRCRRRLDLVRLHYAATPRADTSFWRARQAGARSGTAAETLAAYDAGLAPEPGEEEAFRLLSAFRAGPPGHRTGIEAAPAARHAADEHFARVKRQQRILLETLPEAHAYLRLLHRAGAYRAAA
ncbi:hypothetical protein AMK26_16175 [Streptomyces sp. CB03234]|uniref:tryptophan 7-halogenase n=1 Tax=Streptomyces sp. (strain CB03234) TaxID=1703937 RepID=UPI00093B3E84|nr:tryptophan 7-halogenase [Streptomyces sp. CB03234]OKK04815.1 hypothetical protein AMK26_16175 [Streptomyces sp. CB03234]